MNGVVDVTTMVNFIRARALNHRQFVALLEESNHTADRWLSLGRMVKGV